MQAIPIHGNTIRICAGIGNQPTTSIFKFWVAGNEIYALNRSGGHHTKISLHESGQVHMYLGTGKRQLLARPIGLENGIWLHGLQVRFLLSGDTFLPPGVDLKTKAAYVINVPKNYYAALDLLISAKPVEESPPLPPELSGKGQVIWQTRLKSGRVVTIVARLPELDDENLAIISQIRDQLKPTAHFEPKHVKPVYMEICRSYWSEKGGNVLCIVPMGNECVS